MVESSSSLHPSLQQWVSDNLTADIRQAVHLTNEESKKDPPEEPYRSLYSARELLSGVKAKLEACPEDLRQLDDYLVLSACVWLQIGLNHANTDELGEGEASFETCHRLLEGISNKVKTASVSMQAYNQLGVLWGNRNEQQKALEVLLKSKAVYESHIVLPPPFTETEWLLGEEVGEWGREKAFEGHHTHTLFYLAQVYGNLKQPKLSAQYCQTTLSRQLETREFDAIEWSLNCATLSQYYLNTDNYTQARHCLASASCVFSEVQKESGEEEGSTEERVEKLQQVEADLSRCWTKYCLALLRSSRERQEGPRRDTARQPLFKFNTLEVDGLESEVTSDLVESYEGAKPVFLCGQRHITASKKFYTLENRASEYVRIVQDHSQLFKLVAFFESDGSVQCRMHKRRVDMLSGVLEELNPQHYLMVCRQLMFELADTHSEMADIKIVLAAESPSPHAVAKVNKLLRAAIQYYQKFVDSFAEAGGVLPDPIDEDFLRPILLAKLHTARLHTKLVSPDTSVQTSSLQKALDLYQWLVDYGNGHAAVVNTVFGEEMAACREMLELMPLRIAAIS